MKTLVPALMLALLGAGPALADGHLVELCHRTGSEKNPTVSLRVAESALPAHLAHGDSLGSCDDCSNTVPDGAFPCGGPLDVACPGDSICIGDPAEGCDPLTDPDCIGFCAFPLTDPEPEVCPPGFVEVDDETDDCNPDCGDMDCRIICVATNDAICEGFAGFTCDDPEFPDCGETLDDCHPDCGGADCGGTCVDLTRHPPVACDADGCCPRGSICIDGDCWSPVLGDGGDGGDGDGDDADA
jgi:hypothetical protein